MAKEKETGAVEIMFDQRNYRKHSKKNKDLIKKSLEELGAGRSVLLDKENSLIAGNGVFEQARVLGIPVRVVETDGSELIAVKRTDLATADEKRKKLALADNAASDLSEWDVPMIQTDWVKEALADWGVELPEMDIPSEEDVRSLFEESEQNQDSNSVSIKINVPRRYESDIEDIKEVIEKALQAWEGCVLK